MKAFEVKGRFLMGDRWQGFTKELMANNEVEVVEKIYSRLGSKHRVKRSKIQISKVREIPIKDVSDPIIKYQLKTAIKTEVKENKGDENE